MITVSVTSDSGLHELKVVNKLISDLIASREESNAKKNTLTVKVDASDVMPMVHEAIEQAKPTFNATELAEAETLGKPVCSTVGAEVWQTAHVDMTVNTSVPTPQSVFGQPAQAIVNVANPVAPPTDNRVLDADGLTWDARIHSSSKEMNKDGTWRKRRGVADELVRSVEAELRGVQWVSPEVPTTAKQAIENQTQIPVVSETSEAPPTMVEVKLPDMGTLQPLTFTELLDGVTKAMVSGQLSQNKINEALATIGLTALPHLLGNPALIPAFRNALGGVV